MADTRYDLASRALVRVGAKPIVDFDDGSSEAVAVSREYEGVVRDCLSKHPWRFASRQALLNRVAEAPVGRWAAAWEVPADCIAVSTVTLRGQPIAYDRYGDKLVTDDADGLVVDYLFRPDETAWPPYFAELVVQELAAALAMGLARDPDLGQALKRQAQADQWPRARSRDSQAQTSRRIAPSRLVAVRAL